MKKQLALIFSSLFILNTAFASDIEVEQAYANATFPHAPTGAIYLTLMNAGNTPVTLTGASVPETVAADAQIHITEMNGDMMKMREITEGILLTPGEEVKFNPGGRHIMLMGLEKGLVAGDSLPLSLSFSDHKRVEVVVTVKARDESAGHHHH